MSARLVPPSGRQPDGPAADDETPHTPLRPLWSCRADGQHWPCREARLRLTAEFDGNPSGLTIYLASMFCEAAQDIHHLDPSNGPSPRELFDRFVGWVRKGKPPDRQAV
ncbi:hypothetical protein ACLQ29_19900 [Micromonospora sp. DT228]|uniref:hypothetical protein n=1 Tax=Micromonospora sp. DT228 TaxID=3393443 RepID=UPI003CF25258